MTRTRFQMLLLDACIEYSKWLRESNGGSKRYARRAEKAFHAIVKDLYRRTNSKLSADATFHGVETIAKVWRKWERMTHDNRNSQQECNQVHGQYAELSNSLWRHMTKGFD